MFCIYTTNSGKSVSRLTVKFDPTSAGTAYFTIYGYSSSQGLGPYRAFPNSSFSYVNDGKLIFGRNSQNKLTIDGRVWDIRNGHWNEEFLFCNTGSPGTFNWSTPCANWPDVGSAPPAANKVKAAVTWVPPGKPAETSYTGEISLK